MFVDLWTPEGQYAPEALRWGKWLFCQECPFIRGVQDLKDLIPFELPEVAIAGRSNVGKSSLINGLTGRLDLARTSKTPGRTQQLNFFELGKRLLLVDMPGYGYAAVSKTLKAHWTSLLQSYLQGRPTLQRVYLLVDSRVGLKSSDVDMMSLLDRSAVSYQLVLTKVDKISQKACHDLVHSLQERLIQHVAAHPRILPTSAEKKIGLEELKAEMAYFSISPSLVPSSFS